MKTARIMLGLLAMIIGAVLLAAVGMDPAVGITVLATGAVAAGVAVKSSKELKEERSGLLDQMQAIIDKAKTEKRDLSDDDSTQIDGLNKQIEQLNTEIARRERMESNLAMRAGSYINTQNQRQQDKEVRNYSFLKAMRGIINGSLEGLEKEMHEEAIREARVAGVSIEGLGIPTLILKKGEKRDMTAAGGSSGSEGGVLVPTILADGFIDTLAAKMVLMQMGAQFLDGLVGNVDIAKKATTSSAAWEGETDAGAETSPTWSKIQLTPNRLGAYIQLSKRLINQTSMSAEKIARDDLERAIRIAVETEAIVGTNLSTGILADGSIGSVVGDTNGAAPDWADIVNLEREVAVDNADIGTLGYLTNPKVVAKLKQTAIGTDQRMIIAPNEKELNGYKMGVTTLVPSTLDKGSSTGVCSAIIFGNFSDIIIANWAGMDIVIDPYTEAKNSLVNIIVNSWWDVALRNSESFAAMKDALTT